jgi:uncharacterized protein YecA (UPF0149 family)
MNNQHKLTLAAMTMLFAKDMNSVPDVKHKGSKGNVCGRDFGKGLKKQPRNSLCECGSGKKSKNCCVHYKTN